MKSKPIIRQLLFFLMAVLLPSAVLLSFGVVLLRQETELNERRLDELRTFAARAMSDSLLQALESSYNLIERPAERYFGDGAGPRLLVLGRSLDGQVDFFRDVATRYTASAILEAEFQQFLREKAREEVSGGSLGDVISSYEARLALTSAPEQKAFLELRIARALEKAELADASKEWDRDLLSRPSSEVDEYGLPFAYYAADRLSRFKSEWPNVATRLLIDLHSSTWMTPDALLFLTDLLKSSGSLSKAESEALARVREEHDVASFLESRTVLLQQNGAPSPSWFLLPELPWLVRRIGSQGGEWVAAAKLSELRKFGHLQPASLDRGQATSEDDRALSAQLDGLVVTIDSASLPQSEGRNRFFIAGLILVLGLTMFGGYLLWRDVRRETRLAQLRTQFVSSVSHELRTPLTSIRLFAETMLSYGGDKAERDRNLTIIANESARLTRMLNNVLNTSRIDEGTMSYRPEFAEVSEVVTRAAEAMEYSFRQAGLELHVDTETVWTHFDPDAIEQALINLLSNSLKYASTGKRVALSCARNGKHVKLTVADDGPGIAEDEQEHIFERFYRADRVDNRKISGAGLGLALVEHIAVGHNGRITVKSSPGKGATFTIHLPLNSS